MAVQKSRKTPSKRDMRRSHDRLRPVELSEDSVTGEVHRRHHVTAEGFYRGRQIVEVDIEADEDEDDSGN